MRHRDEDEEAWEARLAAATERADPFMAWLGVIFGLMVGYELAVDLTPAASRAMTIAGWAIWAVFVLEYVAKLVLAPNRGRFVRRHWLSLVALAIPTLRLLRFLRLLRLGRALPAARVVTTSYRSVGSAGRLLGSRAGYLAAVTTVVIIAVAELAYLFERDHPQSAFDGFGDALMWAFAAVVALQADPMPSSLGAHLVMLAAFAFGLVVVASLAGTVGAFLLEQRREGADR